MKSSCFEVLCVSIWNLVLWIRNQTSKSPSLWVQKTPCFSVTFFYLFFLKSCLYITLTSVFVSLLFVLCLSFVYPLLSLAILCLVCALLWCLKYEIWFLAFLGFFLGCYQLLLYSLCVFPCVMHLILNLYKLICSKVYHTMKSRFSSGFYWNCNISSPCNHFKSTCKNQRGFSPGLYSRGCRTL